MPQIHSKTHWKEHTPQKTQQALDGSTAGKMCPLPPAGGWAAGLWCVQTMQLKAVHSSPTSNTKGPRGIKLKDNQAGGEHAVSFHLHAVQGQAKGARCQNSGFLWGWTGSHGEQFLSRQWCSASLNAGCKSMFGLWKFAELNLWNTYSFMCIICSKTGLRKLSHLY